MIAGDETMRACALRGRALTVAAGEPVVCSDCERATRREFADLLEAQLQRDWERIAWREYQFDGGKHDFAEWRRRYRAAL